MNSGSDIIPAFKCYVRQRAEGWDVLKTSASITVLRSRHPHNTSFRSGPSNATIHQSTFPPQKKLLEFPKNFPRTLSTSTHPQIRFLYNANVIPPIHISFLINYQTMSRRGICPVAGVIEWVAALIITTTTWAPDAAATTVHPTRDPYRTPSFTITIFGNLAR